MKIFKGTRIGAYPHVVWEENDIVTPLLRRNDIVNHSPDGFEWGYGGSGPAQLALAILMEVTDDKKTTLKYYQTFKRRFVEIMPSEWSLSESVILDWLKDKCKEVGN